MPQLLELCLPNDGPPEQPAAGQLVLNHPISFIAGPNGSGKSRLLKWLAPRLGNVSQLPMGSKLSFTLADVTSPIGAEILQIRKGDGPYTGTIGPGSIIQGSGSNGSSMLLPTDRRDLSGKGANYDAVVPAAVGGKLPSLRLDPVKHSGIWLDENLMLPANYVSLRYKVLSAVRLRRLEEVLRRQSNLTEFIAEQRSETAPLEAIALMEVDPTLEIEVTARVEALTGVKCQVSKEGNAYRVNCSRSGRQGSWPLQEEADGVINLLLLLPYLYSARYDLLFIDEPEAHLFPGLQQTFRSLVYDAAERTAKRIVLATHSEKIVAPPAPHFREAIHITIPHVARPELVPLKTAISRLGLSDSGDIHAWLSQQAFGDNQDSIFAALFASEVVIVEGPFDLIFLDRLARYVGREFRAGSVALVEAGGNKGVAKLARFLRSLGRFVKVVIDDDIFNEPATLRHIIGAMEASVPELSNPGGKELVRTALKNFDVHVLTRCGIENYYHTLSGAAPTNSGAKRDALIKELKSIESMALVEVRIRYPELVGVLEAAVRRMPDEWLHAHEFEVAHMLSRIMLAWRKGQSPVTKAREFFADATLAGDTLILVHRFLPDPPLTLQPNDDVITVVQSWIGNFRLRPS